MILVAADPKRIHIQMDADSRLAAGAAAAVRFFADAAGLDTHAARSLQRAAAILCEETFFHVTPAHPRVDVYLERFEDRMEVAFSQEEEPLAASPLAATREEPPGRFSGVDRVEHEHRKGASITRLTKFLAPQS